MTKTQAILPGERAQYRKVGKVEVLRSMGDGSYEVRFLTGPRHYRQGTHTVWLSPEDVLW